MDIIKLAKHFENKISKTSGAFGSGIDRSDIENIQNSLNQAIDSIDQGERVAKHLQQNAKEPMRRLLSKIEARFRAAKKDLSESQWSTYNESYDSVGVMIKQLMKSMGNW